MKNIFVDAGYIKRADYGILIDSQDIKVKVYNTQLEKDFNAIYYSKEVSINADLSNKYIYLLEAYISTKEYGRLIDERNINIAYFNSEEEALSEGINTMRNGIKRDIMTLDRSTEDELDEEDLDLLENERYFNYTFNIYKIKVNRKVFGKVEIVDNCLIQSNDKEERLKYYTENLPKQKSKEELYDFLIDLIGGYQINSYSIDGKLMYADILWDYRTPENLSIKSLLGYHVEKFKVGDTVKVTTDPQYKDKLFVIKYKYTQDCSIYESDDPLHHIEGYVLYRKNDPDKLVLNDYSDDFFYDEDLELVEN